MTGGSGCLNIEIIATHAGADREHGFRKEAKMSDTRVRNAKIRSVAVDLHWKTGAVLVKASSDEYALRPS